MGDGLDAVKYANNFAEGEFIRISGDRMRPLTRRCTSFTRPIAVPRKPWLPVLALAAVAADAARVLPQGIPETVRGEMGRALDSVAAAVTPFGFSGQLLVAAAGEVVIHKAYGVADAANRRPMTTATVMGIASMSKQFAAAAALRLAQQGRLSLSDPIERWLEGVPDDKRGITLDQLLTHTAGIRLALGADFQARTQQEQINAILAAPLTNAPGSRWRYSNAGYVLVAAIVEAAAGTPYTTYLREALFKPAGMTATGFLHDPPREASVARTYVGTDDRGAIGEWPENHAVRGAGDIVSTVGDLWRWDRALQQGRILDADWRERYFTPQVEAGRSAGYAYGLFVHRGDSGTTIEHGGDMRLGYNGGFFRYPKQEAVLLVLSNASLSPGEWMRHTISSDLEKIIQGESPRATPPPARLPTRAEAASLAGTWRFGEDRFHLIDDGTHLWLAAEGQAAVKVLSADTTTKRHLEMANGRMATFLDGLLREPPRAAYLAALTDSGASSLEAYLREWDRLTSALGPFERFTVAGSQPFFNEVSATAHLRFRDGWVTLSALWADAGRGRILGTHVVLGRQFPVVTPAAIGPDGMLVVYDPWDRTTLRVAVESGALRFLDGTRAVRIGPAAWRP